MKSATKWILGIALVYAVLTIPSCLFDGVMMFNTFRGERRAKALLRSGDAAYAEGRKTEAMAQYRESVDLFFPPIRTFITTRK